jgi:hypothetical protein
LRDNTVLTNEIETRIRETAGLPAEPSGLEVTVEEGAG